MHASMPLIHAARSLSLVCHVLMNTYCHLEFGFSGERNEANENSQHTYIKRLYGVMVHTCGCAKIDVRRVCVCVCD